MEHGTNPIFISFIYVAAALATCSVNVTSQNARIEQDTVRLNLININHDTIPHLVMT